MDDRNRRIFLFLGALIIALLMALIVLLVTSEDPEPIAADTTISHQEEVRTGDWRLTTGDFL